MYRIPWQTKLCPFLARKNGIKKLRNVKKLEEIYTGKAAIFSPRETGYLFPDGKMIIDNIQVTTVLLRKVSGE